MLKQQLENQIELLKEQIHSARMNDAHYDQRARTIDEEIKSRETQLTELETSHAQIESKIKEQKKEEDQARQELIEMQSRLASLSEAVEANKKMCIRDRLWHDRRSAPLYKVSAHDYKHGISAGDSFCFLYMM